MIEGEESGTVQEILEQLAVHYEDEVDTILKIYPLLLNRYYYCLLGSGCVIGSCFNSSIYNIGQNIQ